MVEVTEVEVEDLVVDSAEEDLVAAVMEEEVGREEEATAVEDSEGDSEAAIAPYS